MLLRGLASPVPTQTRFGFEGAIAIAPIEGGYFSKIGFHDQPESTVLKTPPEADPR
jgi:hypothetical protein